MEIKNTTVMTKEFYISFQKVGMIASKVNLVLRIALLVIMLCTNCYVIYNTIYLLVVFRAPALVPYMLILLVFTVLYIWFTLSMPGRLFKKYHLRNATMKFTFHEDKVVDETICEAVVGSHEFPYKCFKKIYETKAMILIYVDHMHVLAVDKDGFEDESDIPCLREALRAVVGDKKYIMKK